MPRIENGDRFPTVEASALDRDDTLRVPDDLGDGPTVVLFYRGHW